MKKLRTKEPQNGILLLHITCMQNDICNCILHHQGVVLIVATEYVHECDVMENSYLHKPPFSLFSVRRDIVMKRLVFIKLKTNRSD